MVFIAIGAIKAAKAAKREYDKDKKRSEIIIPLHKSRRNDFENASASTSPDWWNSEKPEDAEQQPPQVSHNSFGAWSRDQLMEQMAQEERRQEECDTRFREQLSNSSASLGSIHVSSASHSPVPHVSRTRSESDKGEHSHESLKQILPPTILPPVLEQEGEMKGTGSGDGVLSNSASRPPKAKPPRPTKQRTFIEGSYEAMLKGSCNGSHPASRVGSGIATVSSASLSVQDCSANNGSSHIPAPSRRSSTSELVSGSFESNQRMGVTKSQPANAHMSADGYMNQSRAPSPSAFASSGKPKRLVRQGFVPVYSVTTNAATAEGTFDKQGAKCSSAFANTSTTKRVHRPPSGSLSSPKEVTPVHMGTRNTFNRNSEQSTQRSAFQQQGVRSKMGRARDSGATVAGFDFKSNALQNNMVKEASMNSSHEASSAAAIGPSCMSAEGTMKKRRPRRPFDNN